MDKQQNTEKTKKIFIVVIVIQAILIGWLIVDKITTKQQTIVLIEQLESSTIEKDSISGEFANLLKGYDDLKTNNDTLNAKLDQEKLKIQQLMEELKKTKSSNRVQIEQYKKELETLRSIMRSYIVQIDSLHTKNQILLAENEKIKTDYNSVLTEKDKLNTVKDSLNGRIQEASVLKALALKASALNERDKETNRISKASKFQICFNLSENNITPKGNKNIYIRLSRPDGNIILNESSGFFNFNSKEIAFSSQRTVNYTGAVQNVCIYFNIRETLSEGKYGVDVYTDGSRIGSTEIYLQ